MTLKEPLLEDCLSCAEYVFVPTSWCDDNASTNESISEEGLDPAIDLKEELCEDKDCWADDPGLPSSPGSERGIRNENLDPLWQWISAKSETSLKNATCQLQTPLGAALQAARRFWPQQRVPSLVKCEKLYGMVCLTSRTNSSLTACLRLSRLNLFKLPEYALKLVWINTSSSVFDRDLNSSLLRPP